MGLKKKILKMLLNFFEEKKGSCFRAKKAPVQAWT